jgi:hypothetical protein
VLKKFHSDYKSERTSDLRELQFPEEGFLAVSEIQKVLEDFSPLKLSDYKDLDFVKRSKKGTFFDDF